MTIEKEFLECKENALKSLEKANLDDEVDRQILPVLNLINKSSEYYTSSSCAGRIILLEIPKIGDKKNARFVGIWHRTIKSEELLTAAKEAKKGMLWLLAQSPIIHISTKTNDAADKIVKIANACGFKNSAIKSFYKRIVVEVCSTERLDAPIGKDGELLLNKEHLELLVEISNEIIKKSGLKLKKLEEKLRKDLSTYKTTK